MPSMNDLPTPALILDAEVMGRNAERMYRRVDELGLAFRPHVKTAKSLPVVERMLAGRPRRITVSTLREAEAFFAAGYRDIVYAVGIVPAKFPRVADLVRAGADMAVLTDDVGVAEALAGFAAERQVRLRVFIELDVGGRRAGVPPDSAALMRLGQVIGCAGWLELAGVLCHGGHAYACGDQAALTVVARREAIDASAAAERLRRAGIDCPTVSIGSSPAAAVLDDPAGATEIRAGVYIFNDLDQVDLGCCRLEDIAISVLASVIGHNRQAGTIVLDAGTLALSKDGGIARAKNSRWGYGLVCDATTMEPLNIGLLDATSQEHGLIRLSDPTAFARLPVGSKVRILPNHACITAAGYASYAVIRGNGICGTWDRVNGW